MAVAVFAASPGNQLDDRFELWQTLAGVSSTLGLVALLLGSLAAVRDTHGVLGAVIPGGIAVIGGFATLLLLTTLPYGH